MTDLLLKGIEPIHFTPIHAGNHLHVKLYVCIMDDIPPNLIVNQECEFYHWDEVENFFKLHKGNIKDYRKTDWNIPNIELTKDKVYVTSNGPVFTFGDKIITKDYKVYKVCGTSNNKTKTWFNIA